MRTNERISSAFAVLASEVYASAEIALAAKQNWGVDMILYAEFVNVKYVNCQRRLSAG